MRQRPAETGKKEFTYVTTITQAARTIQWHLSHSLIWLRNDNTYPIFFNDLNDRPFETAKFMAEKIGVEIDERRINDLLENKDQIRHYNLGQVGCGRALLNRKEGANVERMFGVFYDTPNWLNTPKRQDGQLADV